MIAELSRMDSVPRIPATTRESHIECEFSQIEIDELFSKYAKLNFLYEEKLRRLNPFWKTIKQNWQSAMDAGLVRVCTFQDDHSDAWASVVDWRTTYDTWWSQHLVSAGNPVASRAVMLATQKAAMESDFHRADQNWFRPNNKMPKRIFGSIEQSLGSDKASVCENSLIEVALQNKCHRSSNLQVFKCDNSEAARLVEFARTVKGDVYVAAEGLSDRDLSLRKIDRLYQQAGMRRYRSIWVACNRIGEIVAALFAYRGPLGLNFSFLENRSDLLICPGLSKSSAELAVDQLISAASQEYEDFEPGYIPMIACPRGTEILQRRGEQVVRKYCQSIWLRDGYGAWFDHTDSFYSRILDRLSRRKLRAA